MSNAEKTTDVYHKALTLNLDPSLYGTIAEIGAGQEVSRWFFQVGGAAGTIAKTISAYDMTMSDKIYGKGTRYVSKERAAAMLAHEYDLLVERLASARGEKTNFFVFADTISARNYHGTNECHGWLGLRFQLAPGAAPNDILVHVNMLDNTNAQQQDAIGLLGVNLIYGAFFHRGSREEFLKSLFDGLSGERIEIDTVLCSGPEMNDVRPLHVGVALIQNKLAKAVMFDAEANLVTPTECFYKRPLLLLRSASEGGPVDVQCGMLDSALPQLKGTLSAGAKEPVVFLEKLAPEDETPPAALREHVAQTLQHGRPLLLTRFGEHHLLTHYLRRYTTIEQPIRIVMSAASVIGLFAVRVHGRQPGQLLESLAKFLSEDVKVYVKSTPRKELESRAIPAEGFRLPDGEHVTVENMQFDQPFNYLFAYLRSIGALASLGE